MIKTDQVSEQVWPLSLPPLRRQVIKNGGGNPLRFGLSNQNFFLAEEPINEASPQQAAGYQEENLIMMRNHGFSNSSL